jgi:hypothetical protein
LPAGAARMRMRNALAQANARMSRIAFVCVHVTLFTRIIHIQITFKSHRCTLYSVARRHGVTNDAHGCRMAHPSHSQMLLFVMDRCGRCSHASCHHFSWPYLCSRSSTAPHTPELVPLPPLPSFRSPRLREHCALSSLPPRLC